MLPHDKDIFEGLTLDDRQHHTTGQLRTFAKPVVSASVAQATLLDLENQARITAYFHAISQGIAETPFRRRHRRVLRNAANQRPRGRQPTRPTNAATRRRA